jgi:hypothetical protein
MPNSLLAGKIQGISPIRGLAAPGRQRKRARNQFLTSQFPTHPNREFFAALQGIKSGDQGNFCPDQGIPLSSAILGICPADNPIAPTDLKRCREGEPRRRCSKSPKPISSSGAPRACRKSRAEFVDANDRAFRASPWRRGRASHARVHRAHRSRGTEGSNPAPSSGESIANPTFGGASHDDRLLAPYLLRRRVLSTSMLERLTAGF